MRAVVDTNVLVRAVLNPTGTVAPVLGLLRDGRYLLIYSEATLEEAMEVLLRPRMRRRYGVSEQDVQKLGRFLVEFGERVNPERRIAACRDPRDDKFLEAAVSGRADVLVSTDEDLLVLHPFENIPIVRVAEFLDLVTEVER